jgi:hypothetical protein
MKATQCLRMAVIGCACCVYEGRVRWFEITLIILLI